MENRIKHLENDLSQNQILSDDGDSKSELLRQLNEQSSQMEEMGKTIKALEVEKKQQEIQFNTQIEESKNELERQETMIE